MATLVLARDLIDDLHRLEPPIREKVLALPAKFREQTKGPRTSGGSVNLEKITSAADPNVRTVRVDRYWRGIVFYPGESDTYVLTRVLGEEDANHYAQRVRFTVNPLSGAIEVTDVNRIEQEVPQPEGSAAPTQPGLLDHLDDDTLQLVGITADAIPALRRVQSRPEFEGLTALFPQTQSDALQLLADGLDLGLVLDQLTSTDVATVDDAVTSKPSVDTGDFATAIHNPASRAEFTILTDDGELSSWLSDDFALWTVFLHPTQYAYAHKKRFNGPAKLTGAAGTGKTVAALHRAHFLAQRAIEDGDPTDRILMTTFTRALAAGLRRLVDRLCMPAESKRIDVINIDAYAASVLAERDNVRRAVLFNDDEVRERYWLPIQESLDLDVTPDFLQAEHNEVILGGASTITSKREYLTVPRTGRGVRLSRGQRAQVWEAFEEFAKRLDLDRVWTHLQVADAAAAVLDSRTVRPYRHVIVDEAQDFHPAQWRLARAAVRGVHDQLVNDLFIVGDAHQRIYDNRVVLSHLGIETRGRSRRLRLNYRTSQQIHRWALAARAGESVDDLNGGIDDLVGSHSAFAGPVPVVTGHTTGKEEADAVVKDVKELIDKGYALQEIAVVARTNKLLDRIKDALANEGIDAHRLSDETEAPDGRVVLGTMHRVKGGEFRAVILTDISKGQVPLTSKAGAVTPEAQDPTRHRLDIQRERSLLYVAASRARDQLRVHWNGSPSPFLLTGPNSS